MSNLSARILYAGTSLLLLLAIAAQAAPQKDVLLVLDNSGSMRGNDPQFLARGAVEAFINKLNADTRAGIIIFDHTVRAAVPLTAIDDDSRGVLVKSLAGINYRGQLTDSPAAVERAISELKTGARPGADRSIVFITDGIVDTGNPAADVEKTKWLRDELAVEAAENGIKIYAIAFTEHADFSLIQSLAQKTNGEYFQALSAADLAGVFDSIYTKLNAPTLAPPVAPTVTVEPPTVTAEPPAVTVAPPSVDEGPTMVTPLPEEAVEVAPLDGEASPEELLASLTADERQALEEISQETGIPMEQLALELVGPEPAVTEGTVEPGGAIVTYPEAEGPTVVTPLPEEAVEVAPLDGEASPEELLASLTADERQALEEISQETGIPLAQLALELVGPESAITEGTVEPGGAIITYPEDEMTREEERMGVIMLGVAALILLLLVVAIVWFVMRRRKGPTEEAAGGTTEARADQGPATPEAFINDFNHYTDDPAIRLGEKPLMVGRVAGTDTEHLEYLVVNKGTVGRRHAIIKYKDYSFWIVDQGSVNGTFVNGTRVSGEQQLKHGDRIRFHKYEFEFAQPEMDDGFHTEFADPDLSEATIVADAATLTATSGMDLHARADDQGDFDIGGPRAAAPVAGDGDELFDMMEGEPEAAATRESPSAAFADASAFADSDVFDVTGDTPMPDMAGPGDAGDETIDESATVVLDATPETPDARAPEASDAPADEEFDTDYDKDFEAEASAFFEDITVGPTPDDEFGPEPDADDDDIFGIAADDSDQSAAGAPHEQATVILDSAAIHDKSDESGEMETGATGALPEPTDPEDMTIDKFIETDSFDAPETIPPVIPKKDEGGQAGDVTLDAFISTSTLEGGNEDATVMPDQVPDDRGKGGDVNIGDTVILDRSAAQDDDGPKPGSDVNIGDTVIMDRSPLENADDRNTGSDVNIGDTVIMDRSPLKDKRAVKDQDDEEDDGSEDPTLLK